MLKKIIIALMLFFITQLISAYTIPQTLGLTQGYLGLGLDRGKNVPYNPKPWDNFGHPLSMELFGGYGINWTPYFYSALEAFGTKARTRDNYTWGIRVVPGVYLFKNIMGFATVGFVRGTHYPFFHAHPPASNGVQFGGGLQFNIDQISLRGGWYRNNFNIGSTKVLSSVDQFYLSLVYRFIVSPGVDCIDCPRE